MVMTLRPAGPVLLTLLLGGCANLLNWGPPPQREVANQSAALVVPERPVGPQEYMVRQGDTMYSIAFRNSLDYRELAKWNGIGTTFLIHPGQVLRLTQPPRPSLIEGDIVSHPDDTTPPPVARPVSLPTEAIGIAPPPLPPGKGGGRRPQPVALPAETFGVPPPALGEATSATPGIVVGGGQPPVPSAPVAPRMPVAVAAPALPPPPLTSESGGPYRWQWPTDGVVVRGYNPPAGSKGLDFTGQVGQPVYAAAPGKVVYSGSALKGYGELIIIKHDDLRLSAYGYNRTRLVSEGQMVQGGQAIAELGLGPENKPVLHFEIRERGQPVDPVPYLPARTASN
jgi:lipoprotein NlpD